MNFGLRLVGWGCIALALVLSAGCQGTGDRLEVPTPEASEYTGMTLGCLYATSINDVFVGGWLDRSDGAIEGIILRSRDGGKNWRRVGAEIFDFEGPIVQSIHFNDRIRGWFSGVRIEDEAVVAISGRTRDGGGHWRISEIPESRAELVSHTQELTFVTDTIGTVELVFEDRLTGDVVSNVYKTDDAGKNWIVSSFKELSDDEISDPAFTMFTPAQGFRLTPPDEHGVQTLEYTASQGRSWIDISQLHIQRFAEFY